jgi:hypothetical protein
MLATVFLLSGRIVLPDQSNERIASVGPFNGDIRRGSVLAKRAVRPFIPSAICVERQQRCHAGLNG